MRKIKGEIKGAFYGSMDISKLILLYKKSSNKW